MKARRAWIGLAVLLLVLVCVGMTFYDGGPITKERLEAIQKGMTLAEVESIIGPEREDYSVTKRAIILDPPGPSRYDRNVVDHRWITKDYGVTISFDAVTGRVMRVFWEEPIFNEELTIWQRLGDYAEAVIHQASKFCSDRRSKGQTGASIPSSDDVSATASAQDTEALKERMKQIAKEEKAEETSRLPLLGDADQAIRDELKKMQGEWLVESEQFDGYELHIPWLLENVKISHISKIIVKDKKYTLIMEKNCWIKDDFEGEIKCEVTSSVNHIDLILIGDKGRATFQGIYSCDGKVATICYGCNPSIARPTRFNSAVEQTCAVLVLRRPNTVGEEKSDESAVRREAAEVESKNAAPGK